MLEPCHIADIFQQLPGSRHCKLNNAHDSACILILSVGEHTSMMPCHGGRTAAVVLVVAGDRVNVEGELRGLHIIHYTIRALCL